MSSPQQIPLCRYRYDPLDRLTGQNHPDSLLHQRFYCKSRLATEIQGALRCSIVQHGDRLLAEQRSEGGAFDTALVATDQQRSVLHTLDVNHPPRSIAYLPYGHRHPESGLLNLLGFNGERPDPVTGHYLLGNGYRAFNPVLMRFNSPDSWSPFGKGGLNAYAYCEGNPVKNTDPTGHKAILSWIVESTSFRETPSPRRPLLHNTNGQIFLDEPPPSGLRTPGIQHGPAVVFQQRRSPPPNASSTAGSRPVGNAGSLHAIPYHHVPAAR